MRSDMGSHIGLIEVVCTFWDVGTIHLRGDFEEEIDEQIENYAEQVTELSDDDRRLVSICGLDSSLRDWLQMSPEQIAEANQVWRIKEDRTSFIFNGPIGECISQYGYTSTIGITVGEVGFRDDSVIDDELLDTLRAHAVVLRQQYRDITGRHDIDHVNFVIGMRTVWEEVATEIGTEIDEWCEYLGVLDFDSLKFV